MQIKTWKTAVTKRLMLVAAIGLAAPGQFVLATPAVAATNAPPGNSNVSFCKFFLSLGAFSANDLGSCIGSGTTQTNYLVDGRGNGEGAAATTCHYMLDNYPDFFYSLYNSYAECLADDAGF